MTAVDTAASLLLLPVVVMKSWQSKRVKDCMKLDLGLSFKQSANQSFLLMV